MVDTRRVLAPALALLVLGCGGAQPALTASTNGAPEPPSSTPRAISPSTPTPPPTPPTPPVPTATPSSVGCQPGGDDLIVRYITPGATPSAQLLGGTDLVNCRPTIVTLQKTSPSGAGYCTEVALAKDNPGYNVDADPAPKLKNVIAAYGGGC